MQSKGMEMIEAELCPDHVFYAHSVCELVFVLLMPYVFLYLPILRA